MHRLIEHLENRRLLSAGDVVILRDDFSGRAVDAANWHVSEWKPDGSTFLGRTQLRTRENAPPPKVKKGVVSLKLETHNPTGFSLYGEQLIGNTSYAVETGISFMTRARLITKKGGSVAGIFLYEVKPDGVNHDEVDIELLGNEVKNRTHRVLTNIYDNEPLGVGSPVFTNLTAGKPKARRLTAWHDYEIRVTPSNVTWLIDGQTVRIETNKTPDGPVTPYLNIWAPAEDWPEAYNPSVQATDNPRKNKVVGTLQVTSVQVSRIPEVPIPPAPPEPPAPVPPEPPVPVPPPPPIPPEPPVEPGISITSVPALGQNGNAEGRVTGDLTSYAGVAVYIKVRGNWWTKPTFASPLTSINPNGTWTADITTGGVDTEATEIRAYLIPTGFTVPLASGVPTLSDTLTPLLSASVTR